MIHYGVDKKILNYLVKDDRVLFVGSQRMDLAHNQFDQAADYYHNAIDIDYNGDAELHFDLSKRLSKAQLSGIGKFEMVVDSGTGEHVENFVNFLLNINAFLELGGIGIHFNPLTRNFLAHSSSGCHCYRWFDKDFWNAACPLLGFELIETGVEVAYHNERDGRELVVVYTKAKSIKYSASLKESLQEIIDTYTFDEN